MMNCLIQVNKKLKLNKFRLMRIKNQSMILQHQILRLRQNMLNWLSQANKKLQLCNKRLKTKNNQSKILQF